MKKSISLIALIFAIELISYAAEAQVIQGTGPYVGSPGFDRGFQSTQYCGNDPESWIRGSASLDKASGVLNVQVQAETDDIKAGPKGKVFVAVRDAGGQDLANIETDEFGRGGKPPGNVVMSNFNKATNLTSAVASKATAMYVVAQCTGKIDKIGGSEQVVEALKVVITALGSGK